jgi:hypothetical protein
MSDADSMHADDAAIAAAYRLRLGERRFRGRAGARRGQQSGSSLEFFDFRDYAPGDDLRHVDWRSYARTEQLRVRLHEEEVAPFVDIVVDPSASMMVTPAKARALQALVGALLRWSQQEGAAARLLLLGGGQIAASALHCAAPAAAPIPPHVPLRRSGARVLITDGLWPEDPAPLVHTLLGGSSRMLCLQLLDPWELAPTVGSALTLVDCERDARAELLLDARTVTAYRERLQRLCDGLRALVTGGGGVHVLLAADTLAVMCARDLLPAGVVEPA